MKTLDEVINEMMFEQQYNEGEWTELNSNALAYLRKYREEDKELGHAINKACNAEAEYNRLVEDLERNDPLTWDELRDMEGKPVWVEWTKTEESYWCLIGEWFDNDEMRIYHIGNDYADYIHKTIYTPDIVQAYRKERE